MILDYFLYKGNKYFNIFQRKYQLLFLYMKMMLKNIVSENRNALM